MPEILNRLWKKTSRNAAVSRRPRHPLHNQFEADLMRILDEFPERATTLDGYMCYRTLLGRPVEPEAMTALAKHAPFTLLQDLVYGILGSDEFKNRWATAGLTLPEIPVMAELEHYKFWFYLSDRIVGWGAVQDAYEAELASALRNFVKPGMLCCDLGANIGYFSLMMAHLGAEVYAFEPFPKNYALLCRNISENNFAGRIKAIQSAVSDKAGTARLQVGANESDYVAMFVSAEPGAAGFRQIDTKTAVLDKIIPQDRTVECIKMDIEGSEPLALAGMTRILSRDHPRIFFEFNTSAIKEHSRRNPAEVLRILRQNGYRITTLGGDEFVFSGGEALENLVAA